MALAVPTGLMAAAQEASAGAEPDKAVGAGFQAFQSVTWQVHNSFWEPFFGSGANNGKPKR